MIPQYISDWMMVIEQMHNDNTYKLAWGRAIIECNVEDNWTINNNQVIITFSSLAKCILKYYWNQCFFFNLKQSHYFDKQPIIQTISESLIDKYKELSGSVIPIWFDDCEKFFISHDDKFFNNTIYEIEKVLHNDVSYRFKKIAKGELPIYTYDEKIKFPFIILTIEQSCLLKEYAIVISQLLNYKWTQLLEKYNYAPKIASKVKGISENKLRRESLSKYKDVLLEQFKDGKIIDFYSGKELSLDDVSIDHVIPWSFIYSDNIWNLVVTSKSFNSSKSNTIPSEDIIHRLEERNKKMILSISDKKLHDDLEYAIKGNILEKLYFDCRM